MTFAELHHGDVFTIKGARQLGVFVKIDSITTRNATSVTFTNTFTVVDGIPINRDYFTGRTEVEKDN